MGIFGRKGGDTLFSAITKAGREWPISAALDPEWQAAALRFASKLDADTGLSGRERRQTFDLMLLSWAQGRGQTPPDWVVGLLREAAVAKIRAGLA